MKAQFLVFLTLCATDANAGWFTKDVPAEDFLSREFAYLGPSGTAGRYTPSPTGYCLSQLTKYIESTGNSISWEKDKESWILRSKKRDKASGKKSESTFVFAKNGEQALAERVLSDGEDIPPVAHVSLFPNILYSMQEAGVKAACMKKK